MTLSTSGWYVGLHSGPRKDTLAVLVCIKKRGANSATVSSCTYSSHCLFVTVVRHILRTGHHNPTTHYRILKQQNFHSGIASSYLHLMQLQGEHTIKIYIKHDMYIYIYNYIIYIWKQGLGKVASGASCTFYLFLCIQQSWYFGQVQLRYPLTVSDIRTFTLHSMPFSGCKINAGKSSVQMKLRRCLGLPCLNPFVTKSFNVFTCKNLDDI